MQVLILIVHGDGKVTTKAQEMEDFRSSANKCDVNATTWAGDNTVVTKLFPAVPKDRRASRDLSEPRAFQI